MFSGSTTNTSANFFTKSILELNALVIISLSVLEYNIRGSMVQVFESVLGPHWLDQTLTAPGFPLFKEEASIIAKRKGNQYLLTEKRFTEEAGMGFWVELFSRETYRQLKGIPIQAFKYRPPTVKRKYIHQIFKELKDLRNQLVHARLPLDTSKEERLMLLKTLRKADMDTRALISYINPSALALLPENFDGKISELEKML